MSSGGNKKTYPAESVGDILSSKVLIAKQNDELGEVLQAIADDDWDDIQYAYVVDSRVHLVGVVDLAKFSHGANGSKMKDLMEEPKAPIGPYADQEKAVLLAIKHDVTAVPVVDKDNYFLGAVPAGKLIDVMHQEHLEDALLASGIRGRGSHIVKLATSRLGEVFGSRAPWLVIGAVAGLGLGFIASLFERTLEESVALAFFVPVVAYIADSVGSQSQTIAVRALATMKLSYPRYLTREFMVGIMLGVLLGFIGTAGALLISKSQDIAVVVGLSLFSATIIASVLASSIPFFFKRLGRDPALGSGPIGTAIQDMISVVIYFLFAIMLIG
jgi:magnesium transporter